MAFCPRCGKAYEGSPSFCPNCGVNLSSMTPTSPPPAPQPRPQTVSHTGRNAGIVIAVLVVIVIIAIAAAGLGGIGAINRPTTVLVQGSATTTGFSTHAVSVAFTEDTGQLYTTSVVGGAYSISLPNDHTYSVTISGQGALGYSGTCNAGSFTISQGPGSSSLTENWSC
jgi:hypothetical protein